MTPMVVQCSSCLTEFELDPQKVPAAGVRARCSVCSAVITVPAPPRPVEQEAPASSVPQPTAKEPAKEPSATPTATEPDSQTSRAHAQEPEPEHEPEPVPEPVSVPVPEPVTSPAMATSPAPEPSEPPPAPPAPPAPAAVESRAHAPKAFSPPAPHPGWSRPSSAPEPAQVAPSPVEADAGQRRPINPFLTRDPALRAKRLARALVSDIVAYHPARHAEGLRDGTLKTLFRDEIKKSYEEYVDQVGRDFAGSTTHFQDALNDVLASGRKLF